MRQLPSEQRLDSWKAIASYLDRDLATARRWEKGLGLPVHRVGGAGRSVFAYTTEIDAWLRSATLEGQPSLIQWWPWLLISLVACAFIVGFFARA
jgi:hypothetical protein